VLDLAADNGTDQPSAVSQLGLDRVVKSSDGGGADHYYRGGNYGRQHSDQSGAEAITVKAGDTGVHGAPSRVAANVRPSAR
jgi:hypothetical protein